MTTSNDSMVPPNIESRILRGNYNIKPQYPAHKTRLDLKIGDAISLKIGAHKFRRNYTNSSINIKLILNTALRREVYCRIYKRLHQYSLSQQIN